MVQPIKRPGPDQCAGTGVAQGRTTFIACNRADSALGQLRRGLRGGRGLRVDRLRGLRVDRLSGPYSQLMVRLRCCGV